jgi:hypothetical protein
MTEKEKADIELALKTLRKELAEITKERDRLTVKAVQIEQNIHNLNSLLVREAVLAGYRKFTAIGITEALKTVLRTHGKPMTAANVKLGLELMGFDLKHFKNPSAAVHNTLKRMHGTGELIFDPRDKTYSLHNKAFYGEV